MRALVLVVLLVLPLTVYWQTVFHEYGFRDDYSILREAHEEPGKLLALVSSHGRPVFGLVLEASLRALDTVPDLPWLRLTSVVLLSAVGVALWLLLRRRGWSDLEAGAIGAGVTLLPGAQVVVGWAITWPIALALLAAVLGFWLIDAYLRRDGVRRSAGLLAGGAALYFVAGLTYQTSALFAVVPLAALLLTGAERGARDTLRWLAAHIGILFASLVGGYLMMTLVFSEGVVPEAARMRLEPDPLLKLLWFVQQPLPNSLALFGLRDRFATQPSFWIALVSFGAIAALGYRYAANDRSQRWRWLVCVLVLPFVAHSVSLAASSQAIGYRTMLPLSGLFLVLVVFALRGVARAGRRAQAVAPVALCALLALAALLANRNAFTLIAVPQGREWRLIKSAADSLPPDSAAAVYIIRPTIEDRSTERVYADEFGSLSANAEWAATEMFKAAMRQRFDGLPAPTYEVETEPTPPPQADAYDVVIDLRVLREQGDRVLAGAPGGATSRR